MSKAVSGWDVVDIGVDNVAERSGHFRVISCSGQNPDHSDLVITPMGLLTTTHKILRYYNAVQEELVLVNPSPYRVYALEDILEWREYYKQYQRRQKEIKD